MIHNGILCATVEDALLVGKPPRRCNRYGYRSLVRNGFEKGLVLVHRKLYVPSGMKHWRARAGRMATRFHITIACTESRVDAIRGKTVLLSVLKCEFGSGALAPSVTAALLLVGHAVYQLRMRRNL